MVTLDRRAKKSVGSVDSLEDATNAQKEAGVLGRAQVDATVKKGLRFASGDSKEAVSLASLPMWAQGRECSAELCALDTKKQKCVPDTAPRPRDDRPRNGLGDAQHFL